jgi:predicted Zn finger-like uncharacterized protein
MLIVCPSCARSYNVKRAAIGEDGRHVVCPLCETRWFVEAPAPIAMPEVDETPRQSAIGAAMGEIRADVRDTRAEPPRYTTRRTPPQSSRGGFRGPAAALAGLVLVMGLIGKREAITRAAPRAAAVYAALGLPVNIRGVEFADVKTTRSSDAEGGGIEISGVIRNVTRDRARVPSISFEIRDDKGVTLARWSESVPKRVIASNEKIAFASQFPAPPPGSRDVLVRFGDDDTKPAPSLTVVRAGR